MTLAEPGSPCSLPRDGGHAVESLALAHCGRPTSFTRCWGGPGTPWPCQARGYGRNIENFGDGQELPKLPAGVRVTPGAPISRVVSDHPSELRWSCGGPCLTLPADRASIEMSGKSIAGSSGVPIRRLAPRWT